MIFDLSFADDNLTSILARFFLNLVVLFILIRVIYYRFTRKAEFLFSFFQMGIIIFLITSLLGTVDIQIGLALGLFAIFAILRFRTVNFSIKDMSYIFTVLGVSVINSQANIPPPLIGALVINSIILLTALSLEIFLKNNNRASIELRYNKLDLLRPTRRKDLIMDLSAITGFKVESVVINEIDLVKGDAEMTILYRENHLKEINEFPYKEPEIANTETPPDII